MWKKFFITLLACIVFLSNFSFSKEYYWEFNGAWSNKTDMKFSYTLPDGKKIILNPFEKIKIKTEKENDIAIPWQGDNSSNPIKPKKKINVNFIFLERFISLQLLTASVFPLIYKKEKKGKKNITLSKQSYFGLGKVPIGIGAILKGWDILKEEMKIPGKLPNVDLRVMSPKCPHNCEHCFTDKMSKTMSLAKIKNIISEISDLGAKAVNFIGEGEPTVDPDFFEIIEHTVKQGLQPIIFTEAVSKLSNPEFIDRLSDLNVSISPKADSLINPEYQNWVVNDKTGKYFYKRNKIIKTLIKKGFNKTETDGTTRLGFDMVVCKKNAEEVEDTLRFCRDNNLWIVFNYYLPTGRTGNENFDKSLLLSNEEKKNIKKTIAKVDKEYGFDHFVYNSLMTSPCLEFMQIMGNGDISPCPGNSKVIANVSNYSIKEIRDKIIKEYPCHNPINMTGKCLYREII